jgi:hypothetical protein
MLKEIVVMVLAFTLMCSQMMTVQGASMRSYSGNPTFFGYADLLSDQCEVLMRPKTKATRSVYSV